MLSSYDIIHSKKNEIIVCEFNTDEIFDEEKVTPVNLPGLGSLKITIYSDEGTNCPHFHVIRNAKEKITCICLFEPRYFVHNGYVTILNSRQRKQLDKILREQRSETMTNWEFMVDFWLRHNDKYGLYSNFKDSKQPDYTKLNGFIRE